MTASSAAASAAVGMLSLVFLLLFGGIAVEEFREGDWLAGAITLAFGLAAVFAGLAVILS